MSIQFYEATNNTGIAQQALSLMRLDSTQWPLTKIANSCNNWLDFLAGYAIGADTRMQWDDTNHSKLPEGTTTLLTTTSDYSFLTDEQGNSIVTLLGVSRYDGQYYQPLIQVDRNDPDYDPSTFGQLSGIPSAYDKIADNIIRLDFKSSTQITSGLKFYFQRTPSYFASTDTTKTPGFSPLLHRGFIIAAAYDGALTLGLPNLQAIAAERQKEEQKVIEYFSSDRNNDELPMYIPEPIQFL